MKPWCPHGYHAHVVGDTYSVYLVSRRSIDHTKDPETYDQFLAQKLVSCSKALLYRRVWLCAITRKQG